MNTCLNKKYEFDITNYKDSLNLFKECIDLIDRHKIYVNRFYIGDVSFYSLVAEEWLRNANERTIRINEGVSISDNNGGYAQSMSIEIAPGITYCTGYKEKFYIKVYWSHKDNEMDITISTDL